jgi:tetratricopeptide (TPR) repeat protein
MKEKRDVQLPCYLNIALCKLKMQEWAEASGAASAVLAMDENNSKALFRRALANVGRGWLHKANTDLRRAAKLQPQSRPIRRKLEEVVGLLKEQKASEKAAASNEGKPKTSLKFTGSLYNDKDDGPEERLGRLFVEAGELKAKGKHQKAIDAYKRAMVTMLKLPPSAVDEGMRLKIHESTGECCIGLSNFSRAEAEFDKVADLARERGDEEKAVEMERRAKEAWTQHEQQEKEKKEAEEKAEANGEGVAKPEIPEGAVSWPPAAR